MTKHTSWKKGWVALLAGTFLWILGGQAQVAVAQENVTEVVVLGNRSVDDAVILSKVRTRPGQVFSQKDVNEDLKNLYALGYFANISVDASAVPGGVKVAFIVKEKPFLRDILVSGNTKVPTEKILAEMESRVNKVLDEAVVTADLDRIRDLYQGRGFHAVDVTYKVTVDERAGRAILAIRVVEGAKIYIKEVGFEGVSAFDVKLLRRIMKTKNKWLLRSGYLKEEDLREDLDRLRAYYVSKGYIDMKVSGVDRKFDAQRTALTLVVKIQEGHQYKVSTLTIQGSEQFPVEDIKGRLKIVPGTLFVPELYRQDVRAIEDYYLEKGYIDARVNADTVTDYTSGQIALTYAIQEGDLSFIEKIDIQGNIVTKDKVIRRELAVLPGQQFDGVRIRRSRERLQNLGYFNKVDVDYKSTGDKNKHHLVVSVEEKKTGELSFGAGFSSVDNLIGFAEVTQSNFDWSNWPNFSGGGQKLRLRVEAGPQRQDFLLSFTEPWFLDRRLSAGFDAFARNLEFLSDRFEEDRLGFNLRTGRPLTPFLRADAIYTLENVDLTVSDSASSVLRDEEGSRTVSKVGLKLDNDTRDNFFFPTKGSRTLGSGEVAGLGGDTNFAKIDVKHAHYFPVPFFEGHVFKWSVEGGVVEEFAGDTRVPIFDRFFLGGPNSLRGFSFREVGPKDDTDEPLGGKVKYATTLEYTFPIVEFLHGAFFYDAGNVHRQFDDIDIGQFNSDIGVGVRLRLPIGPVQLDYGFPITTDSETTAGNGEFQFNLGTTF